MDSKWLPVLLGAIFFFATAQALTSVNCRKPEIEVCPQTTIPICGTNGKSYLNICHLEKEVCNFATGSNAGVNVKHQGSCNGPRALLLFSSSLVETGHDVTFRCEALLGTPSTYIFTRNGEVFRQTRAPENVISVRMTSNSAGIWGCMFLDNSGNWTSSSTVTINTERKATDVFAELKISGNPILPGNRVAFECFARPRVGLTQLGYAYFLNGRLRATEMGAHIRFLKHGDEGLWSCSGLMLENRKSFTSRNSAPVPLFYDFGDVAITSFAVLQLRPTALEEGKSFVASCITGKVASQYIFEVNGLSMRSLGPTMSVERANIQHGGNWRCKARGGEMSNLVTLTIRPREPITDPILPYLTKPILIATNYVIDKSKTKGFLGCMSLDLNRERYGYYFFHNGVEKKADSNWFNLANRTDVAGNWTCRARDLQFNETTSPWSEPVNINVAETTMDDERITVYMSSTLARVGSQITVYCNTSWRFTTYIFMKDGFIKYIRKTKQLPLVVEAGTAGMWTCTGYDVGMDPLFLLPAAPVYFTVLNYDPDSPQPLITLTYLAVRPQVSFPGNPISFACSVLGKQSRRIQFTSMRQQSDVIGEEKAVGVSPILEKQMSELDVGWWVCNTLNNDNNVDSIFQNRALLRLRDENSLD